MQDSILLLALLGTNLWAQPVLLDARQPSVYILRIEAASGAGEEPGALLELRNNTQWAISIRTESLYIGEKVKPLTLKNGKGVLAIRPSVIISPCYAVEATQSASRETINNEPYQRLKLGNACTVGATSWIPSGGDVRIRVPSDHLAAGRRISVDFQYEWEDAPNVQHRVLFMQVQPARRPQP